MDTLSWWTDCDPGVLKEKAVTGLIFQVIIDAFNDKLKLYCNRRMIR